MLFVGMLHPLAAQRDVSPVDSITDSPDSAQDAASSAQDAASSAQDSPDSVQDAEGSVWYYGNTIVQIKFEGLSSVRENEITGITEQYIGRPFSDADLQDLQQRLYALDLFDDIIPRAARVSAGINADNEMILILTVTEIPLVARIYFEGNKKLSNALLQDTVLIKRNDVIIESDIRADIADLERLYRSRGFPNAQIVYRIEADQDSTGKNVYFDISEGEQEVVRQITFIGNVAISSNVLTRKIETKPQSLFNRGELDALALQRDRQLIEEYYQSEGYIDAEVLDITQNKESAVDDDRIYYGIDIVINEGNRYTLGDVRFQGNQIYDDDTLYALLRMQSGDLLDLGRFDNDFQSIVNLYFDNGYIFNTIQKIEQRDSEENVVSFTIDIKERQRAHIENITIRGNNKTKDHVILRELTFSEGEVFSASRVRTGVLNLYNLQYFANILPETPPGSAEGLMELILNVEEGQTADIRLGIAFGGTSEFPLALQLGWQDRNFLGNGHTFGIDVNLSLDQQRLNFNFTEPWLGGIPLSLRTDLSLGRTTVSGIPQDVIIPIFGNNDTNAVPDPYTGAYVFSEDSTYGENDTSYSAGDYFPGVPTDAEIDNNNLQTDYEYAGGDNNAPISEEYLLDYVLWSAQVGFSIGYRFPTQAGITRLGMGISSQIQSIDYDNNVFRAHDPLIRNGLNDAQFTNRFFLRAALDSRDLFYNPSSGYYLGQVFSFSGGILFGERHYIRSDTRGEYHVTLFDIPVTDTWNFKVVLGLQSIFSVILPQFFVPEQFRDQRTTDSNITGATVS